MYQPYSHTECILVIYTSMVEEKLQRHHSRQPLRFRSYDRIGPLGAVRRIAGRGLIAFGTWLDPAAGEPAPFASGLRA